MKVFLNENAEKLVDDLAKSLKIEDRTDVISRALTMLKLANDCRLSGGKTVMVDTKGNHTEITLA